MPLENTVWEDDLTDFDFYSTTVNRKVFYFNGRKNYSQVSNLGSINQRLKMTLNCMPSFDLQKQQEICFIETTECDLWNNLKLDINRLIFTISIHYYYINNTLIL